MRRELICTAPAASPALALRDVPLPKPAAGEVLVRVRASSVNPIDARRAAGYGHRLLGLKGAARFPLVLGNDLAGSVEAVGPGVSRFRPGQTVFGLLATGRGGGAHASHVCVPQTQLQAAPEQAEPSSLAVLPYSFTTLWLTLRAVGLHAGNAAGARVLVHGASGGLGQLALQQLQRWGARVTAICGRSAAAAAEARGAELALTHGPAVIASLPAHFDAVLNFASWDDDALLASRLGRCALGQATTVHPLLANFDRLGWLAGAWASRQAWRQMREQVRARAPSARYAWTVFKPDAEALHALSDGLRAQAIGLPIGLAKRLDEAATAFAHVATGQAGRAVLLP